jgi:hypothetical protein
VTESITPPPELLKHWARLEQRRLGGNDLVGAVLELRARVETLEKRCEVQLMQLSDLQDRHHRLTLKVGHLEHDLYRDDDDDEPQQHCLEAMDPPEANSRAMTDLITPPLELVQRVATTLHGVTDSDPNVPVDEWMPEARAVIYVVAAWLREQEAGQ